MSKLSLIHSTQQAGPNTEIYGPRSEYGFLRTARRPIRVQDSSKPYSNVLLFHGVEDRKVCEDYECTTSAETSDEENVIRGKERCNDNNRNTVAGGEERSIDNNRNSSTGLYNLKNARLCRN